MKALVMCIDDKLAFERPKAYLARCGTLTAAHSRHPSTQFHHSQLGTKAGKLTVLLVLVPTIATVSTV
jgi:hypothetical protein